MSWESTQQMLKQTNGKLMVALEESSGSPKLLGYLSEHEYVLICSLYFSLDQSGGPTDKSTLSPAANKTGIAIIYHTIEL